MVNKVLVKKNYLKNFQFGKTNKNNKYMLKLLFEILFKFYLARNYFQNLCILEFIAIVNIMV